MFPQLQTILCYHNGIVPQFYVSTVVQSHIYFVPTVVQSYISTFPQLYSPKVLGSHNQGQNYQAAVGTRTFGEKQRCGNIENVGTQRWEQRYVGTQNCGNIELWEHRTLGTQNCGNIELWEHRTLGTKNYENLELWENRAEGTESCGNVGLREHRTVGTLTRSQATVIYSHKLSVQAQGHVAVGTYSYRNIGLWEHTVVGSKSHRNIDSSPALNCYQVNGCFYHRTTESAVKKKREEDDTQNRTNKTFPFTCWQDETPGVKGRGAAEVTVNV